MQWDKQEFLRLRSKERLEAMLAYAQKPAKMCRSRQLEAYFGETSGADCRQCDFCAEKYREGKRPAISDISTAMLAHLADLEMDMRDLLKNVAEGDLEQRKQVLRELLDKGVLLANGSKLRRSK
jgi:ATP-dependent DNA helicase RecQ